MKLAASEGTWGGGGGREAGAASLAARSAVSLVTLAAPSSLSTWLQVLIELSLPDHRCIDSAGRRAADETAARAGRPRFSGAVSRV